MAFRVEVPAFEFVEVAKAGGGADFVPVTFTEVHLLCGVIRLTPVEAWVAIGLRVQEHAVLDLPPAGIYDEVAHRHLVECVGLLAGLVYVPSVELKSHLARGKPRFVMVEGANIALVGDVFNTERIT